MSGTVYHSNSLEGSALDPVATVPDRHNKLHLPLSAGLGSVAMAVVVSMADQCMQRQWRPLAIGARVLLILAAVVIMSVGQGASASMLSYSPQDVPGPPNKVFLSAASDSALRVQVLPPARTMAEGSNGAPVIGYRVEVAKRVDHVQTFSVASNGPVYLGTYKMTFTNTYGTDVTACLAWNATDAEFETALEELTNIDDVNVTRSIYGAASNGYVYTISFVGRYLVNGEQPNVLVGDQIGCLATYPTNRVLTFTGAHVTTGAQGYVPEIWDVATQDTAGTSILGGNMDLSVGFEGEWTPLAITATVSAGSKTAITSAPMVGVVNRGDKIRIAGETFLVHASAPFTDTMLPLDSYHIRGSTNAPIYVQDTAIGDVSVTQGSQVVTTAIDFSPFMSVGESIKIGSWEFSVTAVSATSISIAKLASTGNDNWPTASVLHITAYKRKKVTVSVNADAAAIVRALNGLPGFGSIDASRVGPTANNGYRWSITFLSLGTKMKCPESPCLNADKVTGTNTRLTNVYGSACATCIVTTSLVKDATNTYALNGVSGAFGTSSVATSRQISGVVDEVQSISTQATAADIAGTFAVNFRNTFAQSVGAIINFDDTAADVQTKLQKLSTLGRLNVTCQDNSDYGMTWMITFLSNIGDLPLLTIDDTLLTGSGANVVVKEAIKGVDVPFETIIDGFTPYQDYYARAFAQNLDGFGVGTDTIQVYGKGALPLSARVGSAPSSINIVGVYPISGSQMEIRFSASNEHGDPVQKYLFEYSVGDTFGVPTIKIFDVYSTVENDIAGTFQLKYGDQVSPLLSVHVSASTLQAIINALTSLRPVTVSRAVYILTGDLSSCVKNFVASKNIISTTALTATQSSLLVSGASFFSNGFTFVVSTQPQVGSTTINVQPGHGATDFTQNVPLIKVDPSGSEQGASGYRWTITFRNEVDQIMDQTYPAFQMLSSLSSVETGNSITTFSIANLQVAVAPTYYGSFEVSNDEKTCDTYVIGAPSQVQILQLFASTTVTQGRFQLKLGEEVTSCISIGTSVATSDMKSALEALIFVSKVTIEEQRLFKVSMLSGSPASCVSAYSSGASTISVVSSGSNNGLTSIQAAALPIGTIVQVSRNPNDFTRHSCELVITTAAPAAGDTTITVAPVGTCSTFTGETRSLKILDFHDYKIRFWGRYPTGQWPTLSIVSSAFGDGTTCTSWSPAVSVYSTVHTIKYEGACAQGHHGTQTILADADSSIGGTFTLSYQGNETNALSFQSTTASIMRNAIESITAPGAVNVSISKYGTYGKAWHIIFAQAEEDQDTIFIKHSYLSGANVDMSVYPTVEIKLWARKNDISGSFRLFFGGQTTERIGYAATHAKVVQELQKLSIVDSVVALGDATADDVGVYSLALKATATSGSPTLTNFMLDGKLIDPTLFLAVREMLSIAGSNYYIQALTSSSVTLTENFVGTTTVAMPITAGLITRQTRTLPGYVSISKLMNLITATANTKVFELPSYHGYAVNSNFYINGNKFTVAAVTGAVVTTQETYTGDNVMSGVPKVFVYDNKLRTTEDLRQLVATDDDLWIQSSVTTDMMKYTVTQVTSRYILVSGMFDDGFLKKQVIHTTNGYKWSLVFRSYLGDLYTINAIAGNDLRGTEVRLATRRPHTVAPRSVYVGNPVVKQTVVLNAKNAADIGTGATYQFTFRGVSTANILWTAQGTAIKQALERLDEIDGVTVTSVVYGNGYVHTITFWGMYPTPTLPLLGFKVITAVTPANLIFLVRGNNAVAQTRDTNLILPSQQNHVFRIYASNAKGISDAAQPFQTRTSMASIVPTPPTSVVLGEYHDITWLSVHYRPPFYTGGAEITMYRLEWDSSPSFDSSSTDYGVVNVKKTPEVQQVTTIFRSGTGLGGVFTLSWGGRTTTSLAIDCTAAQMSAALAVITDTTNFAVDPVRVTRARASWGYTWKITFLHNPGNLALLVADDSLITGDFPRIVVSEINSGFADLAVGDFTHEVQDIVTDAQSLLSGTFKIKLEGDITSSISVDATALEMQDALQAVTALYSIKVSKQWKTQGLNTAIWSVTFAYLKGEEMVGAGNIFVMTIDSTALIGTKAAVRVVEKIVGSDPFMYNITNLRPGVRYYMHVMAYNAEGFGSATSPLSSAATCGEPSAPSSVSASVVDGTTLAVTWSSSYANASCPVGRYQIEWYRTEGVREEQTITTSAGKGLAEVQRLISFADTESISGYFRMSFKGELTQNILWNAPAVGSKSVKEYLERLSTIGTVNVARQTSTRVIGGLFVVASSYTLTIDGSSSATVVSSGLAVNDAIWVLGQMFTVTALDGVLQTITIDGTLATSVPVPVFKSAFGYKWVITFLTGHVGPQELIKVYPSDSWTGNNPGIHVSTIQKGVQPISGTFQVTFASGGLSETTPPLNHDISASDLEHALENLVTLSQVNVARSQNGYGYNWIVTFATDLKNDISLLGVDGTLLHGPSVRIMVSRTKVGTQPTLYCENNGVAGTAAAVQSLQYIINGLQTGQPYAIRVRAHSKEGYGPAAYIPSFQTPRTVPTVPLSVQLIVLSSTYIKLLWNSPQSNGGTSITSYKIEWDTNQAFSNVGSPGFDTEGILPVKATDSSPFYFNIAVGAVTSYYARVYAVNDQGKGLAGFPTPISVIPVDRPPGSPENAQATVLSSYAVYVKWDASSMDKPYYGGNGGLPITQYMVEWDTSPDFDSPASFGLVSGSSLSYTIGGDDPVTGVRSDVLSSGSTYYIRVTAFNAKGAGKPRPTTPASIVAVNQVPSAPRNLTLSVIPNTSIKSEWLNPLYDGGSSLKSYQVEWDEQNDFSSGQSSDATIPIVREVQSLVLSSNVVNEEQNVDATVEVVNEVQVIRTTFTGADEIQVIETKNNAVVDEVQTVTTSATDRNEVQEFRLDANDVNEIQAIRTTVGEIFETQRITVGAVRVNEVQTISLTLYGAASNLNLIGGTLSFSFDNSVCTHCTMTVKYARTSDLVSTLKESGDTAAASTVKAALIALGNIDDLTVSRSTAVAANAVDLTYVYTITFSGAGVAGNVSLLGIQSAITVNGSANSGIPTVATEVTTGNEVTFDLASVFGVVYTCESYSDPYSIKGYSTACTPPAGNLKCASCITAFDGTTFTSSSDLTASVARYDQLLVGPCAFQADVITATTITVVTGDMGALCSVFSGQTLALNKNVQYSVNVPLKTAATTISNGSVVANLLNTVIDSVTVVRTQSITSTFVGSLYDVTFRKRSGAIPLLKCVSSSISVTNTASSGVCSTVTRQTIGSMIAGSFIIGLTTEADATVEVRTLAIPWDASEALMKSTLEAVTSSNNEQVFGTVTVKRSVYSPTGNKWSGGFTWQIEFTSRMGNVPIMAAYSSLTNSDSGQTAPTINVEDEAHPFIVSFAGSRQGNQIQGSVTFSFNGRTSAVPCIIGTNTILTSLHETVEDTVLEAFIVANLAPAIPSIQIMRSPATQARGFTWTITFSDQANGGDVPMLGILPTSLSTTSTNVQSVSADVYETIKGNQLGGTFQLKFNGETTGPILFSADKAAVQAQLNSLSTIKPSSVLVDQSGPAITGSNQVLSYTWLITFRSSVWADPTSDHSSGITGNWKGARAKWDDVWAETGYSKAWGRQVGPMWSKGFKITCIKDGLTTTASDKSQDCTTSVSIPGVGPIKGAFTLTLDSSNSAFMAVKRSLTSAPIAHNAWATAVQSGATGTSIEEILENMLNIGDVAVSRSPVDVTTGGYVWTVTFLRDASPCEQEKVSTDGTTLCNSPGDVPAMVTNGTGLSGSSPTATVCEKTSSATCYVGTVQNGLILRGDFTTFNVLNDPGFGNRYYVTISCTTGSPPCDPITNFAIAPGSEMLRTQMVTGDRFTVGSYSACVYTVVSVTGTTVQVKTPNTCAAMVAGMNNNPRSVNILLPWNANEDLVQRVLEASSDQAKEYGIWKNGRKVNVQRTIHGKYGEVSWQVQFISNPGFTPPGSGNIADITTTFVPNPTSVFGVTVTQTTPGSEGLSGSFLIDFHSTMGPKNVSFDESEDRLQRKLNELNTIGRVIVKRLEYPSTATGCLDSSCSAGWDDQPVDNPGTRGGYRWRIRFMKVTGEYGGVTFPSGSGNVGSLSVSVSTLGGNEKSVDVSTNVAGSDPITGSFALNTSTHATPLLPYSSSADSVKQGIESMDLFGEVDVVQSYLVNQLIPNAVATVSKDGLTASITGIDDIRQFIAPGNIIRFGTPSVNNLVGTNGDSPLTSVLSTSIVQVAALSPVVIANPVSTKLLFPGMQLRIDGLIYNVQRSGQEVQTVTVTRPTAAWTSNAIPNYFSLILTRGGATAATSCLAFNQDYATVETNLISALHSLGFATQVDDIQVTRSGPVTISNGQQTGYVYSIYFQGDNVAGDVSQLTVDFTACSATITGAQVVIDTITDGGDIGHQQLLLATDSGQVVDATGYFKLTLNGQTTGCLTWGISESDLELQLENLLNARDVLVARRGSGQSVTEVQRLRMTSNTEVTSGTTGLFQLMFTVDGNTAVTGCLAYGISAQDLQTAINQMSNLVSVVDHVNVTRDGDGTSQWGYGYEYLINFEGPASGGYSIVLGNVNQMEIINVGTGACAAVASGNPALIIETLREGAAGFTYDIFFLDYVTAYTPLLALQDERTATCTAGWVHNGGSSRKASVKSVSLGGSSEIQTLVAKNTVTPSVLGAYKLTFGGVTSACIPFASTASQLQTALTSLSTIGSGGVLVSRDIDPLTAPNGYVYQITFVGELVTGNVPLLVVDPTSCQATIVTSSVTALFQTNGGQSPGKFALTSSYGGEQPGSHIAYSVSQLFTVMDEQFEIQQVIVSNPNSDITVATGVYTLVVLGITTRSIPWNANEDTMQTALTVTGVTSGDIIVTRRTDSAAAPNGYVYFIYFSGNSVKGNVALITVGTKTNFGSGTVVPSLVRNGVNGVSTLSKDSIPLASPTSTVTSSQYLARDSTLNVYKVNGFFWTIKFKSTVGNIPALGLQKSALVGLLSIEDNFVPGSSSNSYVMTNLLPGINYYVRASASTDVGMGPYTSVESIIPSGVASSVQNIAAGYALNVREVQEIRLAATHINEIQSITTSAAEMAEVQTLQTSAAPDTCFTGSCVLGKFAFRVPTIQTITVSALGPITAGSYSINFARDQADAAHPGLFAKVGSVFDTTKIQWNAEASDLLASLIALSALDAGDIIVTRDGDASSDYNYGYIYSITFVGNNVAGETSAIVISDSTGACGTNCDPFVTTGNSGYTISAGIINLETAMGTDTAVQQVIVNASKPLFAGSYKLIFNHLGAPVSSTCIPFDAPARGNDVRAMETILNAMSNIDKVYVTRRLDPVLAPFGFVYRIFFYGNGVYGTVNTLTYTTTGCATFQTQENNVLTANGVDGAVIISMVDQGGFSGFNTFVAAATATADLLEQDLNQLPIYTDVSVSRSLVDAEGGFIWTVAFSDSDGNVPQFICAVDTVFANAVGSVCGSSTITDGNVLSGSFLIESSDPISFDADAATVKAALEAMSWVGTVQVIRSPATSQLGFTWTITFLTYHGDVPPLMVTSLLVGTGSDIEVTEIRKGNGVDGTFTLSYSGSTTSAIKWNATATAKDSSSDGTSIQEKLEALGNVGAVSVTRSTMDEEGGYTWKVTFLDNVLNPGDLPLLQSNSSRLQGVGVVLLLREVVKGSNAVGDQLWLSFDPPATDNGSPIMKYLVRWDTSAAFDASPAEFAITEPEKLYQTQHIVSRAPSFAWSNHMTAYAPEIQSITIVNTATNGNTFQLTFRGALTTTLTVGTSTSTDLLNALSALSSIGSITMTPAAAATLLQPAAVYRITFTSLQGDLPQMISSATAVTTIAEVQKGATSFRKKIIVFSCAATSGTVNFKDMASGLSTDVAFGSTVAALETALIALYNVESDSISVTSAQTLMCVAATPSDVTIVFDRVYGNLNLQITPTGATITANTAASIDGIYADVPETTMSGTFQIGYRGEYTRSLNAESSYDDVRYALEDLGTIQTVGVSRNQSYQPITSQGTVDVINGEIFVTCSTGQLCDFAHAGYGLPGTQIRIGGTWYTIRTDSSSAALPSSKLYLGDVNGREIGYLGATATGVTVYEWTKGYVWTVTMMNVDLPLGYLQAKIPRLYPSDSSVKVIGSSCFKCYYIPTQTTKSLITGQLYYIAVYAYNANGQGLAPTAPASATPSRVPNAPSNVDLVIVSGQQLEVFFSPPALASTSVNPNFNNGISSYIVQWDVNTKFLHGIAICASCCVSLRGNTLTVSSSLVTLIQVGTQLTIADQNCVLKVTVITDTTITVVTNTCNNFNGRAYPLYYYTYPPAVLSGLLIQGSPPYRYLISGLVIATKYYIRVAAVNSVPVQQIALDGNPPNNRKWSYPLAATTKDTVPDPPVSVFLYPFSGTTLEVQIQPPTRDGKGLGGTGITFYWIDVDIVSTFDSPSKASPVEVDVTSGNLPALYTGGPLIYYLKNLQTGVKYFVQVKAKNSVGYSRATIAPNPLAPTRNPDGPVNVKISTVTSSSTPIDSATVMWQKPVLNGGLAIASYKIEWWGANAIPEVQVIELKWTTAPTSATFTLAFGGGLSGNLPMDVAPENLRSALMNIFVGGVQVVGHVAVSRTTVNVVRGYQWLVTFLSAVNAGDQPMIQLDVTATGGTGVSWRVFEATTGAAIPVPLLNFPGKREIQVLLTSHPTATVGGYFRLSYKGSAWSNYLPATITAGDLQLALKSLPTIGQVIVNSGGASLNGHIWTITFDSNVGNVPAIAVDASKIMPSTAFVGIKDGDNAVRANGVLCVPGEDICSGTWSTFTTGIAAMASPGEIADSYQFYETIDASTLTYKITGLTTGKLYYVAVTAKNALGLGTRVKTAPVSIIPPVQVPNPPINVAVNVNPGIATQLLVSWNAPTSTGGADVRMYQIEYDSSPLFTSRGGQQVWCPAAPTYAVWKVTTSRATGNTGDAIGSGYFNLLLKRNNNVQTSEPIPWNAVAMASDEVGGSTVTSNIFCTACAGCADQCPLLHRQVSGSLESKLDYLNSISSVEIRRSAAATDGGYTWTITFMDQGDDFILSVPTSNSLSCSNPVTCNIGTYQVVTTKITAGVSNSACTGVNVVVPSIGALNKGQLYYVRVFAFNSVGFSLPSNAANPQKPMVVPGPPTGVTLQVLSSTELQVLFSPPDDDGGDTITSYQVDWATDNSFANAFTGVMVSLSAGAPYYFVASSLVKGTYYFVRVKAGNSQGYGAYQISSPTSLNPYTTPSAPTQVVLGITSGTMLTVQWDAPSNNGGDAVSGYVVQWDISSSFDSLGIDATTVQISAITQRSYTITTLTTGTVYYVRVAARNSGGIGTWQATTPVSQAPANQRPGKPHTLTATAVTGTAGQLLLNWQIPRIPAHGIPCSGTLLIPQTCPTYSDVDVVYGGSAFESYLIQYSTRSDFSGYLEATSATTMVLLTRLNSGLLYYVRVLTVNSGGLKSDFCARSNSGSGYLCPDQLVLLDGSIVTGAYVTATPA